MHIIAAKTYIQLKLLFLTAVSIFNIQFKHDSFYLLTEAHSKGWVHSWVYSETKPDKVRNEILISKMFLILETTVIPQQQQSEQVKKKNWH